MSSKSGTYRLRANRRGSKRKKRWYRNYRARMAAGVEWCRHCGRNDELTFEHIVDLAKGGRWQLDNMTILCLPCNWACRDRKLPKHKVSLAAEEAAAPPDRRWSQLALVP